MIGAEEVRSTTTKGPLPAARAGSDGCPNRSSIPRCQRSSEECGLASLPTPARLSHVVEVMAALCQALRTGEMTHGNLSALTASQI